MTLEYGNFALTISHEEGSLQKILEVNKVITVAHELFHFSARLEWKLAKPVDVTLPTCPFERSDTSNQM
jgi:hypothetical protein